MNAFVIDKPPRIVVPVVGGGLFPVRRVYCVGRNYAAHAREMGGDPDREPPFFFTKPYALLPTGLTPPIPRRPATSIMKWELVVAIGRGWYGHSSRRGIGPYLRLCCRT